MSNTFNIEKHLGETFIWIFKDNDRRWVRLVDAEKEFDQPGISCGFVHFADPSDPTKCLGFGGVTQVYNTLKIEGKIK